MKPNLALQRVSPQHGHPPLSFIAILVACAMQEDISIFAPNDNPGDIFASVLTTLGTPLGGGRFGWDNIEHRRGAVMEVSLVHAALESDWNWREGVDTNNRTSMTHKAGEEAGAFEMSFDMELLGHAAMRPFALAHGIGDTPEHFIACVKGDPFLDLQTYWRLLRVNIAWAGPIIRREIHPFLRRDRMEELMDLVASGWKPTTEDLAHRTIGQ